MATPATEKSLLKSQGDAAPHRATIRRDLRQYLAILSGRLRVQQIARIYYGLRADRQSETGKILRYLNTQRGIVNPESSGKRIDGENRGVR